MKQEPNMPYNETVEEKKMKKKTTIMSKNFSLDNLIKKTLVVSKGKPKYIILSKKQLYLIKKYAKSHPYFTCGKLLLTPYK